MITTSNHIIVLTTVSKQTLAEQLASQLVELELAACVNIMPKLKSTIRHIHPYTTPEIIALPIILGAKSYLDWLSSVLQ